MMIPAFMHFYHYTLNQVLDEYAVTFYSLINAMYRIQATQNIDQVGNVAAGSAGKEGENYLNELRKQAAGLPGIIKEVKTFKETKT